MLIKVSRHLFKPPVFSISLKCSDPDSVEVQTVQYQRLEGVQTGKGMVKAKEVGCVHLIHNVSC